MSTIALKLIPTGKRHGQNATWDNNFKIFGAKTILNGWGATILYI